MSWTKEQREVAVLRYAAGKGARELAAEYGVTRNAVIGAAYRAGVTRSSHGPSNRKKQADVRRERAKTLQAARRQSAPKRSRARPARKSSPKPAAKIINRGAGVALLDLKSGQCRWPVAGTGAETRFCGAQLSNSDSRQGVPDWCDVHCQVGTVPRRRPAPKRARDVTALPRMTGGW